MSDLDSKEAAALVPAAELSIYLAVQQLLSDPRLKKGDSHRAILERDQDRRKPTWLLLGPPEAQMPADGSAAAGKICEGLLGALVLQGALYRVPSLCSTYSSGAK